MAFPAGAKTSADGKSAQSRLDLVREKLEAGANKNDSLMEKLNRDYDLRVIRFGTSLESIAPGNLAGLKPQDPGTRLLELLQQAARDSAAQSGIVVFSDGIANGDKKSLDGAPPLPVPVFTVGVGDAENFTDVRIAKLSAPEFAFRGREFKLDLTVAASGMKGKSLPLYFNRGKNLSHDAKYCHRRRSLRAKDHAQLHAERFGHSRFLREHPGPARRTDRPEQSQRIQSRRAARQDSRADAVRLAGVELSLFCAWR
jgi:hypothetical protein